MSKHGVRGAVLLVERSDNYSTVDIDSHALASLFLKVINSSVSKWVQDIPENNMLCLSNYVFIEYLKIQL